VFRSLRFGSAFGLVRLGSVRYGSVCGGLGVGTAFTWWDFLRGLGVVCDSFVFVHVGGLTLTPECIRHLRDVI
jgi:hypothetical protein